MNLANTWDENYLHAPSTPSIKSMPMTQWRWCTKLFLNNSKNDSMPIHHRCWNAYTPYYLWMSIINLEQKTKTKEFELVLKEYLQNAPWIMCSCFCFEFVRYWLWNWCELFSALMKIVVLISGGEKSKWNHWTSCRH
jgi:hypothetical protein